MIAQFTDAWVQMLEKLENWLDIMIISLPNFLIAVIIFIISLVLSRYISRLSLRLLDRSKLQRSMKNLISRVVSIIVILFGIIMVLGILDLSKTLNTILAGAGVVGLAVGLALQGALANVYSGIVLSYVKFIKFGDWIESNDHEGQVVDIDLRSVTLKQPDNNMVYIPNKLVVENPIKNFSTTAQSRVILSCGVAYSTDLRFAMKVVKETIADNFDEVNIEDIIFIYREFGDSSINFEIRFWIESLSPLEVARAKSIAIIVIKEAFDKNNITIPFPIRTLDFPMPLKISGNNGDKEA